MCSLSEDAPRCPSQTPAFWRWLPGPRGSRRGAVLGLREAALPGARGRQAALIPEKTRQYAPPPPRPRPASELSLQADWPRRTPGRSPPGQTEPQEAAGRAVHSVTLSLTLTLVGTSLTAGPGERNGFGELVQPPGRACVPAPMGEDAPRVRESGACGRPRFREKGRTGEEGSRRGRAGAPGGCGAPLGARPSPSEDAPAPPPEGSFEEDQGGGSKPGTLVGTRREPEEEEAAAVRTAQAHEGRGGGGGTTRGGGGTGQAAGKPRAEPGPSP